MPLTAKRDLYVRLMSQGMQNSAACREVGVNRKTGQRWRLGRVVNDKNREYHYAPIVPPKAPLVSPRYLSDRERLIIADGVRAGRSSRSIATELKRSTSTVCRERSRNAEVSGEYRPHAAHQRMLARRPRPKTPKIESNGELRALVQERLDKRWSSRTDLQQPARRAARPRRPSTGARVDLPGAVCRLQRAEPQSTSGVANRADQSPPPSSWPAQCPVRVAHDSAREPAEWSR